MSFSIIWQNVYFYDWCPFHDSNYVFIDRTNFKHSLSISRCQNAVIDYSP